MYLTKKPQVPAFTYLEIHVFPDGNTVCLSVCLHLVFPLILHACLICSECSGELGMIPTVGPFPGRDMQRFYLS